MPFVQQMKQWFAAVPGLYPTQNLQGTLAGEGATLLKHDGQEVHGKQSRVFFKIEQGI